MSKYARVASGSFSPTEIVALIDCKVVDDRTNVDLTGFIVWGLGPGTRNEEPFKTLEGFFNAIIGGRNVGFINE